MNGLHAGCILCYASRILSEWHWHCMYPIGSTVLITFGGQNPILVSIYARPSGTTVFVSLSQALPYSSLCISSERWIRMSSTGLLQTCIADGGARLRKERKSASEDIAGPCRNL